MSEDLLLSIHVLHPKYCCADTQVLMTQPEYLTHVGKDCTGMTTDGYFDG